MPGKLPQRVFFWLAACLFAGWIGWLAFLVVTKPPVLSRDEFLVADLAVVAHIDNLTGPIDVKQVLWARDPVNRGLSGPITLTNLADCQGWKGPGDYLLPLLDDGKTYEVADPTGIPAARREEDRRQGKPTLSRSPGYLPYAGEPRGATRPPQIYPDLPATRQQLARIYPP